MDDGIDIGDKPSTEVSLDRPDTVATDPIAERTPAANPGTVTANRKGPRTVLSVAPTSRMMMTSSAWP